MSTATATIEKPRYALVVEWDAIDQIYIGRCPELFGGGVHGTDREKVFAELCVAVDEVMEASARLGLPLPPLKASA
jgi:predicted RNase H-like HicB family nuclease